MSKFNNGKPYHGSEDVEGGKLRGQTDQSDYFYFLCPKCDGDQIMRVLEYGIRDYNEENEYNKSYKKKAKDGFILAFHLYCEKCKFDDFVKMSNTGWQEGSIQDQL